MDKKKKLLTAVKNTLENWVVTYFKDYKWANRISDQVNIFYILGKWQKKIFINDLIYIYYVNFIRKFL